MMTGRGVKSLRRKRMSTGVWARAEFREIPEFFFPQGGGGSPTMTTTEANPYFPRGDKLRLERWPTSKLVPSPRNARTHSKGQVSEIKGSIRAFGFSNPILVTPDGDVIA